MTICNRMKAFCLILILLSGSAVAQTQVPNDFQAGQPARAAEINDNFAELESAVDDAVSSITSNTADIAVNGTAIQSNQQSVEADLQEIQNQLASIPAAGEPVCFDNAYLPGAQFRDRATGIITGKTILRAAWSSSSPPTLKLYYYQRGGNATSSNTPFELVNLNEGLSTHAFYDAVCVTVLK